MDILEDIPAAVSFGLDILKPSLATDYTGKVLYGIQNGEWSERVEALRRTSNASERKELKRGLPFFTPGGTFSERRARALIRHSGQLIIDLDQLCERTRMKVIQNAVADPFCLAAFHSPSGKGIKLLFRIPEMTASQHSSVFLKVAQHVENTYGVKPDLSGRDVSRACFVSFDRGLWVNPSADVLDVSIPKEVLHSGLSHCVTLQSFRLMITHIAAECIPYEVKPDGTAKTHRPLLDMAKQIGLRSVRCGHSITTEDREAAITAFIKEANSKGHRLRGTPEEYLHEFSCMLDGIKSTSWFPQAVNKWTRWKTARGFPESGTHEEMLLFAIRRHCQEDSEREFFLSTRDAGTIIGRDHMTASRVLKSLERECKIERLPKPTNPRHAQEFKLLIK